MDNIFDSISEWLKELLVTSTVNNLTGLFDSVNQGVTDIADHIGQTPQAWNGSVYNMIRTLSNNVIVPIAGLILAFVMTLEFIQLIIDRNNMHDFDVSNIYKWMFKTACAVMIVTNTWNIIMAVFDISQQIVNSASGVVVGSTSMDMPRLSPIWKPGWMLWNWVNSSAYGFNRPLWDCA